MRKRKEEERTEEITLMIVVDGVGGDKQCETGEA